MSDAAEPYVDLVSGLSWMAVQSDEAMAVVRALRLGDVRECSFREGIAENALASWPLESKRSWRNFLAPPTPIYPPKKCFVAAPTDGWTLVFPSRAWWFEDARLTDLSRTFGEAQAFYCDDKHAGYGWARARGGDVVRRVDFGDEITTVGEGHPPEPGSDSDIDQQALLRVARAWSVHPSALEREEARGYIGIPPA